MSLGIFGGTFDPVHHGHLILARAALERLGLDRVIFIPANVSPHKPGTVPATAADRMQMLRLAIVGEPGFEANDCELRRPPPSYTLDTLREIASANPALELVLLIGADNAAKFGTWHKPDEIKTLARIAVLDRAEGDDTCEWPLVRKLVDISATDIRARVAAGRSIRYLTPDSVCAYIAEQGLYRNA